MEYYKKSGEEVVSIFESDLSGLSEEKAKSRLKTHGPNTLTNEKKWKKTKIFLNQFKDLLVIILLAATAISFLIGDKIDAAIIFIVVLLNAGFGFIQEYRAEKAIDALKKLVQPLATVLRNGVEVRINSKHLVPGDIILLETGDKISADARLIESFEFYVDESTLTGESLSVLKFTKKIDFDSIISDQKNMVFSGTIVSSGRAKAVVVATGKNAAIGKIASKLNEIKDEKTPLQIKLAQLSKTVGVAILVISLFVFYFSLSSLGYLGSFIYAISLAVAAIPDGLAAVMTITLAIGVTRLIKKKSLMRKLSSIETLGSVDVICTDKTGTITKNEMTVKKIFANNVFLDVSGDGYSPKGVIGNPMDPKNKEYLSNLSKLFECATLCNNSRLLFDSTSDSWTIIGDPTEAALLTCAKKAEVNTELILSQFKRVDEVLFTSEKKYMISVCKSKGKQIAYAKGACEEILNLCTHIEINGKIKKLSEKEKVDLIMSQSLLAKSALRVLAFAYKELPKQEQTSKKSVNSPNYESNLIFLGLVGMMDPPREEVKEAIELCDLAGIKTIMITGDYPETAKAIASLVGIKGESMTGAELDKLSESEFEQVIDSIGVYARVSPQHKLKIVSILQKKGHVVAMTGDGVNDAPALKKANVGVALGSACDVAKEASSMIVTDDNFATIVSAIKEGRGIYDNIKKFLTYMFSCNIAEVFVIFSALLFLLPVPLLTIQLLWIKIVTDGLPALALSVDPKDDKIMLKKPRKKNERLFSKKILTMIISMSLIITAASLFLIKHSIAFGEERMRTIVFCSIVLFELVMLFEIRTELGSKFFSNKWLFLAVLASLTLQFLAVYSPLNVFFKTVPLSALDLAYVFGAATLLYIVSFLINRLTSVILNKQKEKLENN